MREILASVKNKYQKDAIIGELEKKYYNLSGPAFAKKSAAVDECLNVVAALISTTLGTIGMVGNLMMGNEQSSMEKEQLEESVDNTAVRELQLYIENDGNIYRQRIKPIIRNLASKMKKGSFDEKLAVKAFIYAVEDGQKAYNKEFGSGSMNLNRDSKTATAEKLLEKYREEIEQEMK